MAVRVHEVTKKANFCREVHRKVRFSAKKKSVNEKKDLLRKNRNTVSNSKSFIFLTKMPYYYRDIFSRNDSLPIPAVG